MEPKVLVVDDEARALRAMEAMLVPAGYSVILAKNGTEAITKAIMSSPDVILLDVMMPGKDGFEVASQLRANEKTKDIPIVMVTALGDVKDRVKALESGADDFLTKPVDQTELRTRVKTLVEKSERIRRLVVQKKRPLVPTVSIIIAVIAAMVSTILIVTNKPVTGTEAVVESIETEAVVEGIETETAVESIETEAVVEGIETEAIVEETETEVVVEKEIEYRDVIREVVKEVTVEKLIEQREFSSKEELEKWLAEDDTNGCVYLFVGDDGIARPSDQYDCDDYALQLQRRASEDGYLMSVTIIKKRGNPHMINLVTMGSDVYYIEPQEDEVWFYCHLD